MSEAKAKGIDFNFLLQLSNIFFIFLPLISYYNVGVTQYIDGITIILTVVMGVQNQLILFWERRHSDPFLTLLVFFLQVYYMFRVFTLHLTGFSREMDRIGPITASDVNLGMVYIILATMMLALGLIAGNSKKRDLIPEGTIYINRKQWGIVAIALSSYVITYLFRLTSSGLDSAALAYILRIFPILNFIILLIAYLFVSNKWSNHFNYDKRLFLPILLLALVILTLVGSRKAILDIGLYTLIAALVVHDRVRVSIPIVIFLLLMLPFSFLLYDLATFYRWIRYDSLIVSGVQYSDFLGLLGQYFSSNIMQMEGFSKLFDRLGFLDIAIPAMTYSELFKPIINPIYYFKSFVDDLSPGITIFDVAKAGQIKVFIMDYGFVARLSDLPLIKYNSNFFTNYAEVYIMFGGFFSLPIHFAVGYIIKWAYYSVYSANLYHAVLYRIIVLITFAGNSGYLVAFGLDWVMSNLFKLLLFVLVTYPFFKGVTTVSPASRLTRSSLVT